MKAKAARRASYPDVLDAPPYMVAEIMDGVLHLQRRPGSLAALAKSALGGGIGAAFHMGRDGPGGWWILDEPEFHFGEDILVPDIAGWRRERMPALPDVAYLTLAPDWVREALSPSTRELDLEGKRPVYAREGVGHLWLVDPSARTLEAFALGDGGWMPAGAAREDRPASLPPFEAVAFPLDALWP